MYLALISQVVACLTSPTARPNSLNCSAAGALCLLLAVPAAARGPALDALLELLRLEVNVKAVSVVESDAELVRLRARPNFRSLGKRYGKRTPAVAAASASLTADQLRSLETGAAAELSLNGERVTFLPEDVVVEREVASDWLVGSDGPYVAALDPSLDDELRAEGDARELTRAIQDLRRSAGLALDARVEVLIDDVVIGAARAAHREGAQSQPKEQAPAAVHPGKR